MSREKSVERCQQGAVRRTLGEANLMKNIIKEKRIILVCGSGGVGKTTTAAALAIQGALSGRKTVVLTIDPAKRLATSLGLDELSGEPQLIDLTELSPGKKSASLHAMMLDTKGTWDQLVRKYSPTLEAQERIFNNKLYQHLSNMMAGSQEYMAMEKVYEFSSSTDFDLIVVDTPPTTHAIDFLRAPQRMVEALENSMVHILLKPALFIGKKSFGFLEKGSQIILKAFDKITGMAVLQDVSDMLLAMKELLGGFQERASKVHEIMADKKTAFVLVAACEDKSVEESRIFMSQLQEMKLPFEGIIINRVPFLEEVSASKEQQNIRALEEMLGSSLGEKVKVAAAQFRTLVNNAGVLVQKVEESLSANHFLIKIPLFETDVCDLQGLQRIGNYLN